jgi:hypothetical protein
VLNKIGESVRKLEIDESCMDGKLGGGRGPDPGLLPYDPESQQQELHSIARLMELFDDIDRNLIRSAGTKVIQIMTTRVKLGESAVRDPDGFTDASRIR